MTARIYTVLTWQYVTHLDAFRSRIPSGARPNRKSEWASVLPPIPPRHHGKFRRSLELYHEENVPVQGLQQFNFTGSLPWVATNVGRASGVQGAGYIHQLDTFGSRYKEGRT
jgi:hypothetical protein